MRSSAGLTGLRLLPPGGRAHPRQETNQRQKPDIGGGTPAAAPLLSHPARAGRRCTRHAHRAAESPLNALRVPCPQSPHSCGPLPNSPRPHPVAPQTTMQWTLSPSRSFVLATLRALHLDPDRGPLLEARATTSTNNIANNLRPHPFTGVPNTAKCENCNVRYGLRPSSRRVGV